MSRAARARSDHEDGCLLRYDEGRGASDVAECVSCFGGEASRAKVGEFMASPECGAQRRAVTWRPNGVVTRAQKVLRANATSKVGKQLHKVLGDL